MGFELAIRASPAPLAIHIAPPVASGTESVRRVRTATVTVTIRPGAMPEFAGEPLNFDPVGRNIDLYA